MFLTIIILAIMFIFAVSVIAIHQISAKQGMAKISEGSGVPDIIGKIISRLTSTMSQFLFGIAVIAVISILIINKFVSSNEGLPVISGIAAYLLGRSFTYKENKSIK